MFLNPGTVPNHHPSHKNSQGIFGEGEAAPFCDGRGKGVDHSNSTPVDLSVREDFVCYQAKDLVEVALGGRLAKIYLALDLSAMLS